jgi:arabinofuranan 3-O-arabinosyltransferase
MYANPARRLAKGLSIWDASRGLGRVREDLWVGINGPLALVRLLGLDTAAAEKVWHGALLALAGLGVVAVVRLYRPRLGAEHLVAGLSAAFGTYSLSFLTPFSDIYLQFALAPWLVVVFVRGVTATRPWRWAAAFALLIFAPGNVDIPGLVYAVLPLVPLSAYLVLVERRVRLGHLLGWVVRAGSLTLLVSSAVLAKLYLASGVFGQRLNDTEAVEVSFRASSWSETVRGLGNWLSYFRGDGVLVKPQSSVYFTSAVVVLCTFVPAIVAFATVWLSRWRPRLLFALMALTSLVVMVGAYPLSNPSPAGSAILRSFNQLASLSAFRNTYKAGPGLVIGVSVLFGYGVAAAARRLRHRSPAWGRVPVVLAAVVLVVNAVPFWTGGIYNENQRYREVPDYWDAALTWLDAQPVEGRVLVLPSSSRTRYRWGWVGDDIFDSLLARPHAIATGVPLSTPQAANLLEAISNATSDPGYEPGTLAPVLARLGIRYVVLRNDLDWQDMGRPRPSAYSGLRTDPDLVPAASFGSPGENTAASEDRSPAADADRALPPVEVLEVEDPDHGDGVRVAGARPPLVVSGDGAAWLGLTSRGLLDTDAPVTYSGALDPAGVQAGLERGAPLLVTDTNRRRLRVLLGYEPDYSHTLAEGQDLDRITQSLFTRPGSQSVAWFADATEIYATGSSRGADGSTPWNRPANAFDGDPATAWVLNRNEAQGRSLVVQLRRPADVSRATVDIGEVTGDGEGVTGAVLRFSDGTEVPLDLRRATEAGPPGVRRVSVAFPVRRTAFVELRVTAVNRDAPTVAVSDVVLDGVDLAEHVQLPEDAFIAALGRGPLATALGRAPTAYLFDRAVGSGPVAEEAAIRRRFRTIGDRPYDVTGELRVGDGTSDAAIAALLGRSTWAEGSSRLDGAPGAWAGLATDGDPSTGWVASAGGEPTLTVRLPRQVVRKVGVVSSVQPGFVAPTRARITAGDQSVTVDLPESRPCLGVGDAGTACRATTVDVPAVDTDLVTVTLLGTSSTVVGRSRVRIDEVVVNGRPADRLPAADRRLEGCRDVGLRLSRGDEFAAVPIQVDGTVGDLLAGRPVPFRGCEVQRLSAGWHRFDGGTGGALQRVTLQTADVPMPTAEAAFEAPSVTVDQESPTAAIVRYDASEPSTLVFQQSWAPGWEATANGRPLGPPEPYDTLAGWPVGETGPVEVRIRYRGQRIFDAALALTAVGLAVCSWLVLRRRSPDPETAPHPDG